MNQTPHSGPNSRYRWEDPSGNEWDIALEFSTSGEQEQPALSGIHIRAVSPGYALTQRTVRQMPISEWERTTLASQAAHLTTFTPSARTAPHSGRPLSDSELQLVADIYKTAERARLSVQRTVAETLGIPVPTATRRIMVARQRGFLPPAPKKGKANGRTQQLPD